MEKIPTKVSINVDNSLTEVWYHSPTSPPLLPTMLCWKNRESFSKIPRAFKWWNLTPNIVFSSRLSAHLILDYNEQHFWCFHGTIAICEVSRASLTLPCFFLGRCLPSAREVSRICHMQHGQAMELQTEASHMVMLWGQFLDHDITLTPADKTAQDCCLRGQLTNTGMDR